MSTDPDEAYAIDIRHGQVAIALAEALQGHDMTDAMIDTVQVGTIANALWRLHGMPLTEEEALQRWRVLAVRFEAPRIINQINVPGVGIDEILSAAPDALHYFQHGELP